MSTLASPPSPLCMASQLQLWRESEAPRRGCMLCKKDLQRLMDPSAVFALRESSCRCTLFYVTTRNRAKMIFIHTSKETSAGVQDIDLSLKASAPLLNHGLQFARMAPATGASMDTKDQTSHAEELLVADVAGRLKICPTVSGFLMTCYRTNQIVSQYFHQDCS